MSKKITRKMVLASEDSTLIINYCAEHNPFEFNMNKALEEIHEFAEVLIKLQTKKKEGLKGITKECAIKEFGDIVYRGQVALLSLFPEKSMQEIQDNVGEHIEMKLEKLKGYLAENKYKGGL